MTPVTIKPELIRWAIDRAGLDSATLVDDFPKLEQWESGQAFPTFVQLEKLSKKTYTPLGYFFLNEPPDETLPIQDFRTIGNSAIRRFSPHLIETVQIMQRRQDWLRDYLIELGQDTLPFVASARVSKNPEHLAVVIRKTLGVGKSWASQHGTWEDALRALRHAVEDAGIVVVSNGVVGNSTKRKLAVEEFRGFVLCDKYAPFIFINGSDSKSAQMFTIAHELAHLWIGASGLFNLPSLLPSHNATEVFCNKVAAEFLIPSDEFNQVWGDVKNKFSPFNKLAAAFKVSPVVAALRALHLGAINRSQYDAFLEHYNAQEKRIAAARPSGGNFYATQEVRIGRRFGSAIVRAAREGKVLFTEAFRLTGLHGQTFDRFAEKIDNPIV